MRRHPAIAAQTTAAGPSTTASTSPIPWKFSTRMIQIKFNHMSIPYDAPSERLLSSAITNAQ